LAKNIIEKYWDEASQQYIEVYPVTKVENVYNSDGTPISDDFSTYVTQDELNDYATQSDLSNYVTQGDLSNYATQSDLSNYVTQDELGNYDFSDYVTHEEFTTYIDLDASNSDVHGLRDSSLALGENSTATSEYDLALGKDARAEGLLTELAGLTLIQPAISIGYKANAPVNNSLAIGTEANANGPQSTAVGQAASAGNTGSVAIGSAESLGMYAVGLGGDSLGDRSVAIGNGSSSEGDTSVATGRRAESLGNVSTAIGRDAVAEGKYSVALGQDSESLNFGTGVLGGSSGSNQTDEWEVPGDFSVEGSKNFQIPHPKPEKKSTHVIRHGAVESPTAGDTLYRYTVQSEKENDVQTIDLPDYFIHLNKDVQIFVTPQEHFGNGYGKLNRDTEQIEIHCQNAGEYNVLVIGTRNDDNVQKWSIKGVEREKGESWTGETYTFSVDEITREDEIMEVSEQ